MMRHRLGRLGCAAPLSLLLGIWPAGAPWAQVQACAGGTNCVLSVDTGLNAEGTTELPPAPISGEGFSISFDGVPAGGGAADAQRRADIALADNGIEVRVDGLGVRPRLEAQTLGPGPFSPGETVTFLNRMNYPFAVARGEIRIVDLAAPGGARTLAILPLAPNAEVAARLPEGRRLAFVYRVIDAKGRFDETRPVLLGAERANGLTDLASEEQGRDSAAIRRIPVRGGAVTVFAEGLPPGARLETLGTTVTPDPSGRAVIQRILPVGPHSVEARIVGPDGRKLEITRDIAIPRGDWLYLGTVDLTFGRNSGGGDEGGSDTYSHGRIAGYAKGTTASGYTITLQADSGEDELDDLFRNVLNKDPSSVINRIDSNLAYPTYGDDSVLAIDAPTSGGFYLKVEKDNNFVLWGDFKSQGPGTELLRNERTLYGAQTVLQSAATTADGTPRLRFEGYAAQPDQLPQRDVLRGTGGSIYFLSKQDILQGSETLTVELRDGTTGRVLSRSTLVQGKDYDINYIQGVVTLYSPLSGYGSGGALLSSNPNGDDTLNLIAQYEWRPASGDVDAYSYGARVTAGVLDGFQLGATFQKEEGGTADQTAFGADLEWRHSDRTFVTAEIARTEGPGYGYITSLNGGLTGDTTEPPDGSGTGYSLKAQVALDEVLPGASGIVSAYVQRFGAGFSSLDYQVSAPELYWGLSAEFPLGARTAIAFSYDHYDEDPGVHDDEGKIVLSYQLAADVAVELGYGHVDRADPTRSNDTGTRDDLAARLSWAPAEGVELYGFGQASFNVTGDLDKSDRVGVGGKVLIGKTWSIGGELSAGETGPGARIIFGQDKGADGNVYFGYTLDPDRTIDNVVLNGSDQGQFVAGGRRRYSDKVTAYAENTYDLFGQQRSLTSTYGVEYARSDRTIYTGAIETGVVTGDPAGDVERTSVSLGVRHDDGAGLDARGRVEIISDSRPNDGKVNTLLLSGVLRYALSDEARVVADLQAMFNDTATDSLPKGDYVDLAVGYAFRPIQNDRVNLLAKYQYLDAMVEQVFDNKGDREPLQRSHVFSIDTEYDLSERWSLGGKLGFRLTESAPDSTTAMTSNNAWLAVANTRYHLVHEWDLLFELRNLTTEQSGTSDFGALVGVYKQVGPNLKLGGSYNFGTFSDDLTDLNRNDRGAQINLIATF